MQACSETAEQPGRFLALRILTTHAPALNKRGHLHELVILRKSPRWTETALFLFS